MANITFLNPIHDQQYEMDFAELVTLIKGSSIKSMAISEDFFELGLSDAFNLRIKGRPEIFLTSTLNKNERPPIRLQVIPEGTAPLAETVERQIHSLRQLYAIAFLINAGRSDEIARTLKSKPNADLENLLNKKDRLFITAASEGTFWLTVVTKTGAAFRSLSNIVPLFYNEGRQALLERMRASTDLKKLEVATKFVDLVHKVEKIKNPVVREQVRQALTSNMHASGKQFPALPKPTNKKK